MKIRFTKYLPPYWRGFVDGEGWQAKAPRHPVVKHIVDFIRGLGWGKP